MVRSELSARTPWKARDARMATEKTVANILVETVQGSGRVRELGIKRTEGGREERGRVSVREVGHVGGHVCVFPSLRGHLYVSLTG